MGGSLATPTSPNDPIFTHLHCNVDRIFAHYQLRYGNSWFTDGPGKNFMDLSMPVFTNPMVTLRQGLNRTHYGFTFDTLLL
jgi:hypothetical protein